MHLAHVDVVRVSKALRDVDHHLCVVLLLDNDATATAVAEAKNGRIIAWDGWYMDSRPNDAATAEAAALADVDWEDWDDMPTKLLVRSTSPWAANQMALWLAPTFSPAREAAMMVAQCADQETTATAANGLRNSRVIAYVPIADTDVYERTLAEVGTR